MDDDTYYAVSPLFAGSESEEESSRKDFVSKYPTLPRTIKDFLSAPETAEKILEISQSLGLSPEKTALFSRIVRRIVAGELFLGKAPDACQKELGLDRAASALALNQILNELLPPIIEEVKTVQRESFISPAPKLQPRPAMPPPPMLSARPTAPAASAPSPQPAPVPIPKSPASSSMPPPPPPVKSAEPPKRQISNLGYLLGEEPASQPGGVNPGNVLNLRDQQK